MDSLKVQEDGLVHGVATWKVSNSRAKMPIFMSAMAYFVWVGTALVQQVAYFV